ncbi:MAG: tyrosine--tRNA ligase [candidate division WS1 bacterium]|nr:tyrosine--tRNA ligase [candidate division WS1 bacterium]
MTPEEQLALLVGDAIVVETQDELLEKLKLGRPLRIKYGADPSAPDLHLGHSVPIRKLRRFQELGHHIIFIIGDFTARIGDPSGRSKTRPMLSPEQIETNAETYAAQVGQILDIEKCEIVYNSQWLAPLGSAGLFELASHYTLARMLERDDFAKRLAAETPISIVELLYPLIQAYDSVAIKSDVELGGTDQTFNFLMARDIMRAYDLPPQVVMTWDLLVGTDGHDKMSKSLGNYIGITDAPNDMYGKLMSIPDDAMGQYYRLLLDKTPTEEAQLLADIAAGKLHPKQAKSELAKQVVGSYHGTAAADTAMAEFERVFAAGQLPSDLAEVTVPADCLDADGSIWVIDLILAAQFASSKAEARRLVRQGGVRLNQQTVADETARIALHGGEVLQVGKRRVAKLML